MRRLQQIVSALSGAAAIALVAVLAALASEPATAQQGPGVGQSRDCQVVRTCNFARNGAVRGCLSSYTCRTCRLVVARCNIGGRTQCREMICSWGG